MTDNYDVQTNELVAEFEGEPLNIWPALGLTKEQYLVLLQPLADDRVASRRQGTSGPQLSYLESWDVKAHLTRIFGFGGYTSEVLEESLVYEAWREPWETPGKKAGDPPVQHAGQWQVAWKVRLRLAVPQLAPGGIYTEVAIGSSSLPDRGEAHDMAVKTAESDALKRAAINLGTQFGLSLYNRGNRRDIIHHTLVAPAGVVQETTVVADPIPQEVPPEMLAVASDLLLEIQSATTDQELRAIWDDLVAKPEVDVEVEGRHLSDWVGVRVADLREQERQLAEEGPLIPHLTVVSDVDEFPPIGNLDPEGDNG